MKDTKKKSLTKGIRRGKLIGAYADNLDCFFYAVVIRKRMNRAISKMAFVKHLLSVPQSNYRAEYGSRGKQANNLVGTNYILSGQRLGFYSPQRHRDYSENIQ
jgi:hypothetical protein